MTLVEVVAALALLAGLLTASLMAASRLKEQATGSTLRDQGAQAAQALMESFWPRREEMPRDGSGPIPGYPGWRYRCASRPASQPVLQDLEARIVRIEIIAPRQSQPALTLEIVLPKEIRDVP
jgi:Tfp pilus assembly protein PilV